MQNSGLNDESLMNDLTHSLEKFECEYMYIYPHTTIGEMFSHMRCLHVSEDSSQEKRYKLSFSCNKISKSITRKIEVAKDFLVIFVLLIWLIAC